MPSTTSSPGGPPTSPGGRATPTSGSGRWRCCWRLGSCDRAARGCPLAPRARGGRALVLADRPPDLAQTEDQQGGHEYRNQQHHGIRERGENRGHALLALALEQLVVVPELPRELRRRRDPLHRDRR